MKHVGRMKNNNAKVAVVFRTIPGDPYSALVCGTNQLGDSYHNALIDLIQESSAQQSNELADILSVRNFPDGNNMLEWLHTRGHLKKVPTSGVLVTPTPSTSVSLDELNKLISEQKGVSLEELAINDGKTPKKAAVKKDVTKTTSQSVSGDVETAEEVVVEGEETPAQLRSKADALFKQAQQLRKKADELDPPKSKKKVAVEAE